MRGNFQKGSVRGLNVQQRDLQRDIRREPLLSIFSNCYTFRKVNKPCGNHDSEGECSNSEDDEECSNPEDEEESSDREECGKCGNREEREERGNR
jgi:hypothetical protein